VARQTLAEHSAEDDLARMQRAAQLVPAQNKVFVDTLVNQPETARGIAAMDSVPQRGGRDHYVERWTRLLAHPSFLENPRLQQPLVQLTGLKLRAELAAADREQPRVQAGARSTEHISGSLAAVGSGVQKTLAESHCWSSRFSAWIGTGGAAAYH
jgi:hypothetical protein